jgi:TPR repeat protein
LEHGDAMLRNADLTSARLFYERAAAGGDGRAALRLGATFDPAFLDRAGLRNVKGDAAEARLWYGRALDLGMAEAKRQLSSGDAKRGR